MGLVRVEVVSVVDDDTVVVTVVSVVELLFAAVETGTGSSNPRNSIVSFWDVGPPLNLNHRNIYICNKLILFLLYKNESSETERISKF